MGAIGGLLGTAGGASGTGYSTPTSNAGLQQPVTQGQVAGGQAGAQGSLDQQNALLAQLRAASGNAGIGMNQAQAYGQGQNMYDKLAANNGIGQEAGATAAQGTLNQQLAQTGGAGAMGNAITGTGTLAGQLGGAGGVGAQTSAIGGLQNALAQQQAVASGQGPNPAQNMLAQATGQNVSNQAALMAGQRGAGANVGLMARQAGQQGAATQQQAAGQAATMQSQQQLNALGQLAGTNQALAGVGAGLTGQQMGTLSNLYGQGAGAVGAQQAGIGQAFNQAATQVGQQQAQQQANAALANQQVQNYLGASGTNISGNVSNAGQLMQGMGGYNTTLANLQGNVNAGNVSLANTNMQGQQAMLGGMMNGAGQAMSSMGSVGGAGGARGGLVKGKKKMAVGGEVSPYPMPAGEGPLMPQEEAPQPGPVAAAAPTAGYISPFFNFLAGNTSTGDYLNAETPTTPAPVNQAQDKIDQSIQAPPQMGYGSQQLYQGSSKMSEGAMKMGMAAAAGARGGKVPAMLSEGEVYVPPAAAKTPGSAANYVAKAEANGGEIKASAPGQKAEKSGNSYDNDKIPKDLEEGGIVIPRSVMQSDNPVSGAAKFVEAILAKKGKK